MEIAEARCAARHSGARCWVARPRSCYRPPMAAPAAPEPDPPIAAYYLIAGESLIGVFIGIFQALK